MISEGITFLDQGAIVSTISVMKGQEELVTLPVGTYCWIPMLELWCLMGRSKINKQDVETS